ncbi:hypothetical protein Micbo1qcDRAFT_173640 [Microdochium bolleyi]|uniref:Uncharacterized protein n=1 Tax=Microdochium bolleyi TaxID=196109 RepID=A0A136JCJ1_9PEZI|nr:hypothetical protein Micbo1qcDRAFT_173640 [Microdochium bolleyi]
MDLAIQPPSKLQAGSRLYPPVVDSNGTIIEESGPYIASPQPINTSSSRGTSSNSPQAQYAVFPDVFVENPGTYTFTVRCYDPTNGLQSWSVLGTVRSRTITVTDGAVACEEPTANERKLLSELRASGNFGI